MRINTQSWEDKVVKVLSIVFVLCVWAMPALVMASPTFEILSEAHCTGIPIEGIDVKLPNARSLGNLIGTLEILPTILDDISLLSNRFNESDAASALPGAFDREPAGVLRDMHLFEPAWTEAAMLTTWNAADDEPTPKVSWTKAPAPRNRNARPPADGNADHRYR